MAADVNVDKKSDTVVEVKVKEDDYKGPKEGTMLQLEAVHGLMQHPYTLAWFEPGKATKHAFDYWVRMQYDERKLKISE